jgi:hypothetical protein
MLVALLGNDELAPVYVIRLWAHCQNRKKWIFENLPSAGLQGICRFPGETAKFEASMIESGFVSRVDGVLEVTGWAEKNSTLIASWSNGSKGGRPRKLVIEDDEKTHGIPTGNPQETRGSPDKRREEKRRDTSVVHQGESGENATDHPPASRSDRSRASRLPTDWALPKTWGDWALAERPDWNADMVRKIAEQFRDHWLSKGGADARKADWEATWRNWVRREKSLSGAANSKTGRAQRNDRSAAAAAIFGQPRMQQGVIDV